MKAFDLITTHLSDHMQACLLFLGIDGGFVILSFFVGCFGLVQVLANWVFANQNVRRVSCFCVGFGASK